MAGRRQPALRGHRRGGRAEPDPRAADGRGSPAELHRRRAGHRSLQRGTRRLLAVAVLGVGRTCQDRWKSGTVVVGRQPDTKTAPERDETRRLNPAIVLTSLAALEEFLGTRSSP